jgi:4-carboxymuconolactone decarboxylase
MPRPAPVVSAQAPSSVREALDALPDLGVFRMLAHAESAFRPWLALGGVLLGALQLDPALRELAILRVASLAGCDYEMIQHEAIAAGVGVGTDQVQALAGGRATGAEFDPRETLVLRFVAAVIDNDGTAAGSVPQLEDALSAREVIELLLVIAQYHGLALLLNTTGVQPDPPAATAVVEAAQANRDVRP